VNTPFPKKMSEAESLRAFADQCVKSPAMYLMALRAHLNNGRTAIGDIIESVADALPRSSGVLPAKSDEQQ
jgi:hypothetical protein